MNKCMCIYKLINKCICIYINVCVCERMCVCLYVYMYEFMNLFGSIYPWA